MTDLFEGERLKAEGMALAAMNKSELLKTARQIAREIAADSLTLTCDADKVVAEMTRLGLPPLGNAAGSIFRGAEWRFTGARVKSKRPCAHANELKVWELVG